MNDTIYLTLVSVSLLILDFGKRRRILIDWDMCVRVEGAEPSGRVDCGDLPFLEYCLIIEGTWQFMSVALLQNNQHVHGIIDDRESAICCRGLHCVTLPTVTVMMWGLKCCLMTRRLHIEMGM